MSIFNDIIGPVMRGPSNSSCAAEALAAASMALQGMICLVCDQVGNRVEVPCLGKNVLAAANALACAVPRPPPGRAAPADGVLHAT